MDNVDATTGTVMTAAPARPAASLKIGVLNLTALGHESVGLNQERAFAWNIENQARYAGVEVLYRNTWLYKQGGFWERKPVPSFVRAGVRGREEYRDLARRGCDVAILNQQNIAAFCAADIAFGKMGTVLVSDATPKQVDELAAYLEPVDSKPLSFLKRTANRIIYQKADACVGWSDWAKRSIVEDYGVPEERVFVVPPGVEIDRWQTDRAGRPAKDGVDILFVGGDFYRKGGDVLLKAFVDRGLAATARLQIVTRTRIDDVVAGKENVFVHYDLPNHGPELKALYRDADLFVLPTRADTLGIALMEAAAAGIPVVSTPVGGIPTVVEDGVTGLLAPIEDFGEAMAALAGDEARRQAMGRAAVEKALAEFDVRKNVARLIDISMDVAARKGRLRR
jgi:glycosyltransferase involved in cell wall biosynthesis